MNIQMKQTRRSANSKSLYVYVTADNQKAVARAVKRASKLGTLESVYNYKENFGNAENGLPEFKNVSFTLKIKQ